MKRRNRKRTNLEVAVDVALARRSMCRRDLAEKVGIPATSLSDWLTGLRKPRAIPDLLELIENALDLKPGALGRESFTPKVPR